MPKNNDKENLESLIIEWINNARSDVINDSVLWINDPDFWDHQYVISKNTHLLIRFNTPKNLNELNQIVIPTKYTTSLPIARLTEFLKIILLHIKILVVPYELQYLLSQKNSNTDTFINNTNNTKNSTKSDEFYIENVDLNDIIKGSSSNLELFLKKRKKQISHLLEGSEITNMPLSMHNMELTSDLNMLDQYKILTSRLAIYIYRCVNFDFSSSTTAIGIYFRKTLGTKSKVFNKKRDSILFSKRENFKAYDLRKNPIEDMTRKLLQVKCEALTDEIIADITSLSIEKIKYLRSQ